MSKNKDFKIGDKEPVFTISVVSRLLKIPIWTLKKLDREKIVSPKRSSGNDRLYSKNDLKQLHRFWDLMKTRNVKIGGLKVIKELEKESKE